MNHNAIKAYYEYLAKIILETLLPTEFSNITLSEKPDLINYNGDGIEVTRALFDGDGEISGRFQKIRNKSLEEIDKRELDRLEQLDCDVMFFDGKAEGYCPPAQRHTLSEIKDAFNRKFNKAPTYSNTSKLFIYSPMFDWYKQEMIEDFTQWAASIHKASNAGFSNVYIIDFTSLYICDLVNQKVSKLDLGQHRTNSEMRTTHSA